MQVKKQQGKHILISQTQQQVIPNLNKVLATFWKILIRNYTVYSKHVHILPDSVLMKPKHVVKLRKK
jgi:hypothetical protein